MAVTLKQIAECAGLSGRVKVISNDITSQNKKLLKQGEINYLILPADCQLYPRRLCIRRRLFAAYHGWNRRDENLADNRRCEGAIGLKTVSEVQFEDEAP